MKFVQFIVAFIFGNGMGVHGEILGKTDFIGDKIGSLPHLYPVLSEGHAEKLPIIPTIGSLAVAAAKLIEVPAEEQKHEATRKTIETLKVQKRRYGR